MILQKHVSAVTMLMLMAGGVLFAWGSLVSSAQANTSLSAVLAEDGQEDEEAVDEQEEESNEEEATIEELKEKIKELQEENEKYKELIEEQERVIQELEEKLEDEKRNEEKDVEEEVEELREETEEKIEDIEEDAKERAEEAGDDAGELGKRVQEKIKETKKRFMEQVRQLKKRAREQKRKGRAGDADNGNSGNSERGRSEENIMKGLKEHFDQLPEVAQENISIFLSEGADDNTRSLGAGERKAVIESFRQAYGKLPGTDEEMARALMIANGRFPDQASKKAEEQAKEKFMEIYDREPDMENPQDRGAIMTMAYGLRQKAQNRSLESEQKGLAIFKDIFGHLPQNTQDWNVMQAITYSGASK
jgi:ElaB/YqjD/DUF883 family membrane-anchored ribosome-binding protein